MSVKIEESWKLQLENEFEQPYFQQLIRFVKSEYSKHTVYPPGKLIFNAFDQCPFDDVKVVIIGQDPYHGIGQAHGLCFSVNNGIAIPPSLRNIYKELHDDIGFIIPKSGNLEKWSRQGILMLNATLTVRANEAGSHQNKGWEQFTDAVIAKLSAEKEHLVFLLWGAYAQRKGSRINSSKHLILRGAHPSPLAANRGGFFGKKYFSKTNAYLQENGKTPIDWSL